VAIADPTPTAAPTQDTSALARVGDAGPETDRALRDIAPGRYLVVEEEGEPVLLPVTGDVCHIGRSPACDVVLEDASVSRRHAVVIRRGDRTVILDDRSLNGVQFDGRRVAEATLHDGDVFALGRVLVRYVEVRAGVGAA
jgi:pSer/pThr/pTyr-binding forkhead associated (FHA) protein